MKVNQITYSKTNFKGPQHVKGKYIGDSQDYVKFVNNRCSLGKNCIKIPGLNNMNLFYIKYYPWVPYCQTKGLRTMSWELQNLYYEKVKKFRNINVNMSIYNPDGTCKVLLNKKYNYKYNFTKF